MRAVGRERDRPDTTGMPLEGAQQLPGGRVPQLERLVLAAREHARAVGRERHRIDSPAECPSKVRISCAGGRVPQLESSCPAARQHARAVGRERHRADPPACPSKVRSSRPVAASHSLSVLSQLPESRRVPSGENATDTTEVGVPLEGAQISCAGGRVPQLERVLSPPPESTARAVGRERHREDRHCECPSKGADQLARWPRPTA